MRAETAPGHHTLSAFPTIGGPVVSAPTAGGVSSANAAIGTNTITSSDFHEVANYFWNPSPTGLNLPSPPGLVLSPHNNNNNNNNHGQGTSRGPTFSFDHVPAGHHRPNPALAGLASLVNMSRTNQLQQQQQQQQHRQLKSVPTTTTAKTDL